jgi:hypothetical protein
MRSDTITRYYPEPNDLGVEFNDVSLLVTINSEDEVLINTDDPQSCKFFGNFDILLQLDQAEQLAKLILTTIEAHKKISVIK